MSREEEEEVCDTCDTLLTQRLDSSLRLFFARTRILNFASSQLAAARIFGTKIITTNNLISMLIEEANRQKAQFTQRKGSGKGKDDESEVLVVGESWKRKKGKANKGVECWNRIRKS